MNYKIFNDDCRNANKYIPNESIDLHISDPPFGINESTFDKHYKRNDKNILSGYTEAPKNYYEFSLQWLTEAKRTLKKNGSIYIFSGWSNLNDILNAINKLELNLINHIIWKYNFGVNTTKKYVSSHYHILYLSKNKDAKTTFNTNCRFSILEKSEDGKSLLYNDMEDVWFINKDYKPNEVKNSNKLPDELIRKIIQYSSNPNDKICDFFLGNFTTANVALKMGRKVTGFELNENSFNYFYPKLSEIEYSSELKVLKEIKDNPYFNQGKKISDKEKENIIEDFKELNKTMSKKDSINKLTLKYGRGRFSIKNIIDD